MKHQSGNQSGTDCSVAWQLQNGRSRIQRGMAADGFRGDYPYAGVAVVAENRNSNEDISASTAVETVRDVFAEGVAFGVEDALRDALIEAADIIRNRKLSGCSAAAIAYSGTHVWYALAGNCRLYRIDSGGVKCVVHDQSVAAEIKMLPSHPEYHKKIQELNWWLGSTGDGKPVCGHARVKQDTTYLVLTAGGWAQFENFSPALQRKGLRKTLGGWLSILSRDLKLAYRRQGGALAAVSGVKERNRSSVPWKSLAITLGVLGLTGYLLLGNPFLSNSDIDDTTDLFSPDSIEEVIIQPIIEDTVFSTDSTVSDQESGLFEFISDSLITHGEENTGPVLPDISSSLPVQMIQVGGTVPPLSADTFAVSLNNEPDPQWENYSPGIYAIRGDTASIYLAGILNSIYPALEIVELDRIVTVRENGVVESARWLSNLSGDTAAGTGVVVETRSSVAGGADWIRNYPVFANGNRADRAGEAGGFMGDSLPGLPSLRNPHVYRLVVVL